MKKAGAQVLAFLLHFLPQTFFFAVLSRKRLNFKHNIHEDPINLVVILDESISRNGFTIDLDVGALDFGPNKAGRGGMNTTDLYFFGRSIRVFVICIVG
jgi:hypothetical protein